MLLQVDETLGSLFKNDRDTGPSVQANLVVIGPFTEDAKAATGRWGAQICTCMYMVVVFEPMCWFCLCSEPVS